MNKILKIINAVLTALLTLIPLIEKACNDDNEIKKASQDLFAQAKNFREKVENKAIHKV